jgi:hypothetical protein
MTTKSETKKRLLRMEKTAQKVFMEYDWTKQNKSNATATSDFMKVQKILEKWFNVLR